MNNSMIPKSLLFLFPSIADQNKAKQRTKQKTHPLNSPSEMQIKLPKEEWAERKLPDVGILPNLYLMNFMPRYRKNILLETQKDKSTLLAGVHFSLGTRRVNLKCKLELH